MNDATAKQLDDVLDGTAANRRERLAMLNLLEDAVAANTALARSEERYRMLFNSMDEGYCIIEFLDGPHGPLSDCIHIEANPAYETNAGITGVVGQKLREMVPDEADGWVEIYRSVLLTGEPVRFERELVATGRHLELSAFRIEPPEKRQVAVLFKDISQRKRAERMLADAKDLLEKRVQERTAELAVAHAELQAETDGLLVAEKERVRLLNLMVTIQDEERRRIARDLHDELGQQITALRLKLEHAKAICGEEPVGDLIDETQNLAHGLDGGVSFLAWELRPTMLDESGLSAALGAYVKEWSRFAGVDAQFQKTGFGQFRLDPQRETNIYRIVQESLNNIHKHAKATAVSILLERKGHEVKLIVEDNGKGFDTKKKRRKGQRLGLVGMRERAVLLGGTIEIESTPSVGTTIFMRVPVG